MKTILELSHIEAKSYFLRQESYCNIDLPQYFNFQPLLDALSKNNAINNIALDVASKLDNVNYQFLTYKGLKGGYTPLHHMI